MTDSEQYIVYILQVITLTVSFTIWGTMALWVAKRYKKIQLSQLQLRIQNKLRFQLAKFTLLTLVAITYLLAFAAPFMMSWYIVMIHAYTFWGIPVN
jgi:hypothetical protein